MGSIFGSSIVKWMNPICEESSPPPPEKFDRFMYSDGKCVQSIQYNHRRFSTLFLGGAEDGVLM